MREELVALAKLAEMDGSARDIDAELKQIPRQLDELRNSVQMLENLLAQEREQLVQAETLKAQQTIELKERNEGLQRARKKVAQASNAREANAAEREVDANRRSIKEREDEIKRIADTIEAKTASLAERETDFEEAKAMLQAQEQNSLTRISELEEQRSGLLNGRDEIVAKVPKNVVKRYERLRGSIPNVVLVIADANCTGCRMALPPQLYIELQRAEELHQCPHCQRMIIHKNVLDD